MGDPRRARKKYQTPNHPWEGARIKEEKVLLKEYGLKNKREIQKMRSVITGYKDRLKQLIPRTDAQASIELQHLLTKVRDYGLIKPTDDPDLILDLNVNAILERRLQTLLFRRGLARTVDQARQFIIHGHVTLHGKRMNVPSYLIKVSEENAIGFVDSSSLKNEEHPERIPIVKKVKPQRQRPRERERRR